MNIRIESNFEFTVDSIQYSSKGELCITLGSVSFSSDAHYQYTATLGSGQAEEKPAVSLLGYAKNYAASVNIKSKTKDSYRRMCKHLDNYGDCLIDKVTTYDEYLEADADARKRTVYTFDEDKKDTGMAFTD